MLLLIRTVTALIWVTSWKVESGWWRISVAGSTGCSTRAAQTPLTWTSLTTSSCCGCHCTSSSTSSFPVCSSPSWLALSSIFLQTLVRWHWSHMVSYNWVSVTNTRYSIYWHYDMKETSAHSSEFMVSDFHRLKTIQYDNLNIHHTQYICKPFHNKL